MKRFAAITVIAIFLLSCADQQAKGKFVIKGEIKNAEDQKIILEEIFFDNSRSPEILDTAEIKNGKFTAEASSPQQGLYRLRMEKEKAAFIFINDQSVIPFVADVKNLTFNTILFNSPANAQMKTFILGANEKEKNLDAKSTELQQYSPADSLYTEKKKVFDADVSAYKKFIVDNIENSSNPIVALFSLGYTRNLEPEQVAKLMAGLSKKFPKNAVVSGVVTRYNQAMAEAKLQQAQPSGELKIKVGDTAPELSMPDTNGKMVSISSFKGKYVLIDFWASWCGPCRAANPNIVNAYNTFKDKNFTILGVSLDRNKNAWLKAIKDDNLTWTHISDLKFWSSAAADIYGFDAIPFNVLLDTQGKIIAINLEGSELQTKLGEVLK